jgi:hypothetical protein
VRVARRLLLLLLLLAAPRLPARSRLLRRCRGDAGGVAAESSRVGGVGVERIGLVDR